MNNISKKIEKKNKRNKLMLKKSLIKLLLNPNKIKRKNKKNLLNQVLKFLNRQKLEIKGMVYSKH